MSFNGHYFTGVLYTGTSTTASEIYTTIGLPSSAPRYNDLYYEVLSAFDSNGNYDQIGLASDYCSTTITSTCQSSNVWTILWSIGTPYGQTGCSISYNWNPNAGALSYDADYTFAMVLNGLNLFFDIYDGSSIYGTHIYHSYQPDTAANFLIKKNYTCQNVVLPNFQVYQEVYNVSSTMSFPQWNSGFNDITYGSTVVSSWSTWSLNAPTSPHGYYVDLVNSNTFVRIDNLAFWVNFNSDSTSVSPGGSFSIGGTLNADGSYCSGTSCPFGYYCWYPTGYSSGSFTYTGSAYIPNSGTTYAVTMSSSASAGTYYSGCLITVTSTSPSEFSTWIFITTVT